MLSYKINFYFLLNVLKIDLILKINNHIKSIMPRKFKVKKAPKGANLLSEYIDTLDERNKQAYDIAKDHLGTSFDLEKSIGFLKFKEKKEQELLAN